MVAIEGAQKVIARIAFLAMPWLTAIALSLQLVTQPGCGPCGTNVEPRTQGRDARPGPSEVAVDPSASVAETDGGAEEGEGLSGPSRDEGDPIPRLRLVLLRGSDTERSEAAGALMNMGRTGVEALVAILESNEDPSVLLPVSRCLTYIHWSGEGVWSGDIEPRVATLLGGARGMTQRMASARILGETLGVENPFVLAALTSGLADGVEVVRACCAKALLASECPPEQATPVLLKALRSSDPEIRGLAVTGLSGNDTVFFESMADVAQLASDESTCVRRSVAHVLRKGSATDAQVLAALARLAEDSAEEVRVCLADTLRHLEPRTPALLLTCGSLIREDQAPELVEAAASVLQAERSECGVHQAIHYVWASLGNPAANRTAFNACLNYIAQVGTDDCLQALAEIVKGGDVRLQELGITALGNTTAESPEVEAILIGALDNRNHDVRLAAAEALGKHGRSVATVWALADFVHDAEHRARSGNDDGAFSEVRIGISSLCQQVVSVPECAAILVGELRCRAAEYDSEQARLLVAALARIREPDWPTLEAIADALEYPGAEVREAAAQALGRWGKKAEKYIPNLTELSDDSDRRVQLAAATALSQIRK